jgi:hypothetical protein
MTQALWDVAAPDARPVATTPCVVPPANKANVIAMVVLAAIGTGVVWAWQAGERAVLEDQSRIWATGITAPDARVNLDEGIEWAENTLFFLRSYHYVFHATYQTPQGPREATLSFASVLRSIDVSSPLELRYDPASPERFAVSWAVERLNMGWAFLVFKWLVGLLWTAMCLHVAALEFAPQRPPVASAQQPEFGWRTRLLASTGVMVVGVLVVMLVWAVADDLLRRWDSYLEVFLGLTAGVAVLAVGAWLADALRRRLVGRKTPR